MKAARAAACPRPPQGVGPERAGCARNSRCARSRLSSPGSGYLADLRGRCPSPTLDPPALQTPPRWGPRTPGLRRTHPGPARSCRGAFRSPRPSPRSGQADGASEGSLPLDIQKLKEKRDTLDKEISQLISEGYSVDELDDHISQLHEYNDIKDVGQMLLGKLAVIRGVTTKELYPEFDLDVND
ncbi:DNA repair protein SWI5 homolog [Talpa occidentalis]|uniref:DNA repair protein SWI5 homolog n=1 Tax=Talpa occidentalis TaxID=50954 RepID=UPI00188E7EDE|nr:DNA repair protein SWI5 homolog [Talpa occidentalis]